MAVLLDMDGLMLDSEPVYRRAWQSAAAALQVLESLDEAAEFLRAFLQP
jgi:beta-phosphoglucomutase-like phosphatase (HAD superfamily)